MQTSVFPIGLSRETGVHRNLSRYILTLERTPDYIISVYAIIMLQVFHQLANCALFSRHHNGKEKERDDNR